MGNSSIIEISEKDFKECHDEKGLKEYLTRKLIAFGLNYGIELGGVGFRVEVISLCAQMKFFAEFYDNKPKVDKDRRNTFASLYGIVDLAINTFMYKNIDTFRVKIECFGKRKVIITFI